MKRNFVSRLLFDIQQRPVCYTVALFSLFVGVFCGAFYPAALSAGEASSLEYYLSTLMRAWADTQPSVLTTFIQSLWNNMRIALVIALAGMIRFGSPFVVIAEAIKGFGLGVCFAALGKVFGAGGVFFALCTVLPQNLVYLPAYTILGAKALSHSTGQMRGAGAGTYEQYMRVILPCLCAIFVGIMVESIGIPFMIKLVSPWFI